MVFPLEIASATSMMQEIIDNIQWENKNESTANTESDFRRNRNIWFSSDIYFLFSILFAYNNVNINSDKSINVEFIKRISFKYNYDIKIIDWKEKCVNIERAYLD